MGSDYGRSGSDRMGCWMSTGHIWKLISLLPCLAGHHRRLGKVPKANICYPHWWRMLRQRKSFSKPSRAFPYSQKCHLPVFFLENSQARIKMAKFSTLHIVTIKLWMCMIQYWSTYKGPVVALKSIQLMNHLNKMIRLMRQHMAYWLHIHRFNKCPSFLTQMNPQVPIPPQKLPTRFPRCVYVSLQN